MNETAMRAARSTRKELRRRAQEQTSMPVRVSSTGAPSRNVMLKSARFRAYYKRRLRSVELRVLESLRATGTKAPENFLMLAAGTAKVGTPLREGRYGAQRFRRVMDLRFGAQSGDEVVGALMDNESLGLRLLSGLRYNKLTSVQGLLSGAKVSVDVFTPTVVRLAEFGLVEARYDKLTRTARGNSVFRYIENNSGKSLKNLFGMSSVTPEMQDILWNALASTKGAATAAAPARAPRQQEAEGYEEAMKNPNYKKYREEAPWLEQEYGRGFVAYANGERVAFAEDMDQLLDKVSALLEKTKVLIQEVPEKVVKTSLPFRVAG